MAKATSWLAGAFFVMLALAMESPAAGFNDGFDAYVSGDYATALSKWQPLAAAGDAEAQFGLGLMYQSGRGVDLDFEMAVQWFRKAADQGSERAQTQLGGMYARGDGVEQDWSQAIEWWREAASHGSPRAQYKLGGVFERGDGVARDLDKAAEWYAMAAAQGYSRARLKLDEVRQRRREEQTVAAATAVVEPAGSASDLAESPQSSSTAILLQLSGPNQTADPGLPPGSFAVQFKSFRSIEAAEAHWEGLVRDHGDLLEGLDHAIKLDQFGTADSVLYRLRAGPFTDPGQARALCAELAKRRILCRPVPPG